jgi:hypothetical protein
MRSLTMFQKTARLLLLGGLGLLLSHAARAVPVAGPYSFFPLTPCRVVDTRDPVGPQGGPSLAANTIRSFTIININSCGVPTTAKAAAMNITALLATDNGDLRIFPYLSPVPLASVINFSTADFALANGAIIPLANITGIDISVQTDMPPGSTGHVHFVVDVTGYFQ